MANFLPNVPKFLSTLVCQLQKKYAQQKWTFFLLHAKTVVTGSLYQRRYNEEAQSEKSTNSLTTTAGDPIPKTGTMSTCSHDSTNPPKPAPTNSPATVIKVAFPAQRIFSC
jgi:hypothetical protein